MLNSIVKVKKKDYPKAFLEECKFEIKKIKMERGEHFLTPNYQFHLLQRHLDISRAITAEKSPLHIASS